MDKKRLYKIAYRMLREVTPLRLDCGLICGRKCCSGGYDRGMQLLPGEEVMFGEKNSFLRIRNENLMEEPIRFAVCRGTCIRELRPLACRVFPLAPFIAGNGKLRVVEDPRARYLCPLLMNFKELKIRNVFKRKVLAVFRLLMEDPDIRNYVKKLSTILAEYARFTGDIR